MSQPSPRVRQLLQQFGTLYTPSNPYSDHVPKPRPVSHALGADLVAILLVSAMLQDLGDSCVTAAEVSRFAGQSKGTTSGKMTKLAELTWLELAGTACPNLQNPCGPRTKHYRRGR